MKKMSLIIMGILFGINGVFYIIYGEFVWSFVVFTTAGIYLFGVEKFGNNSEEHFDSHILTGGLFSLIVSSFLILDKLFSLLLEPKIWKVPDIILVVLAFPAVTGMVRIIRKFK